MKSINDLRTQLRDAKLLEEDLKQQLDAYKDKCINISYTLIMIKYKILFKVMLQQLTFLNVANNILIFKNYLIS